MYDEMEIDGEQNTRDGEEEGSACHLKNSIIQHRQIVCVCILQYIKKLLCIEK